MNDLENVKKALVIGTGVSGINAAALLVHKGVEVILYDQKKDADMKAITEKLNEAGAGEKTEIFLGELTQEIIRQCFSPLYFLLYNAKLVASRVLPKPC